MDEGEVERRLEYLQWQVDELRRQLTDHTMTYQAFVRAAQEMFAHIDPHD